MAAIEYTIRRKLFVLLGATFTITRDEKLIGICQQKAFKLKEDLRVYGDEAKTKEVVRILARNIIDFSAAYDVFDATTNTKVGALKRKGWASMLRDSWIVLDPNDQEIGKISEDSALLAFIRRSIFAFIPQSYSLTSPEGRVLATMKKPFAMFFETKMNVTVHDGSELSPLLVLASGLLLMAIEGKQQ